MCVYCQSVCCRLLRRYVCACTVSPSAVDVFVGTCLRVLSVRLLQMVSSVRVYVYCQSVCYRWFRRYVCACIVSLLLMRFVSMCVCMCVCVFVCCVCVCVCVYLCTCIRLLYMGLSVRVYVCSLCFSASVGMVR